MSNSHGELFTEIGKLVLAANSGQSIDLNTTVADLADRYRNLGMTEETMLKVVTRSIGAISYSMARTNSGLQERLEALRENGGVPMKERSSLWASAKVETNAAAPAGTGASDAPAATMVSEPEAAVAVPVAKPSNGRRSRRSSAKSAPETGKGQTPFPSGVRLAVIP